MNFNRCFLLLLSMHVSLGKATTETLPVCVGDTASYVTDAGCKKVWRCVGGRLSNEPVFTCGQNLVFSKALDMCVWQGNEHDDCSSSRIALDKPSVTPDHAVRVTCVDGQSAVPHESDCQLYYDCAIQNTTNHTGIEPDDGVLRECEYPKLFSNVTKQCESFLNVACGNRREPVDTCDYQRSSECHSSEICSTCAERYPSCKGQPNGPHADVTTFNRSNFIVCFNDRLVARENCENDRFGERMIFYENGGLGTSGSCWSVHDIPHNDGGLLPNCPKGVFFKVFPDEGGACDRFYECMYGMAFVRRCPGSLVYDSQAGVCSTREYVCTPCGMRICDV
ncbi:uncharacterized protein LOC110466266 [Mizuhopecten yessoensis]|uniref:Chitin-binding type-2 domain-containing protein n=1 Tax=Mizuhopecten yessoensis TaxID=6573 RepID=A0A210PPP8_MIZYE|nr:uncharacterized protein LOC110466266 [Mizuhopecten yessoensis]OWF38461.1 hypothetical protein KP79_PYT11576 [Mizuhopecten yessoensis]